MTRINLVFLNIMNILDLSIENEWIMISTGNTENLVFHDTKLFYSLIKSVIQKDLSVLEYFDMHLVRL